MAVLDVDDLVTGYGESEIVHSVSLDVAEEEIVCVVGPNGAGKSTVLKCIAGLIEPWEGQVSFHGEDVSFLDPDEKLGMGVAYVPQGRSVFPDMTVLENLKMGAYTHFDADYIEERLEAVYDLFGELEEMEGTKAKDLSGGQQQMVELSRALMMDPELLLVDEPSLGLAPKLVSDVLANLTRLRDGGHSVLIVEQNVSGALDISDRAVVIADGSVAYSGSAADLEDEEELGRLYLGG